MLLLTGEAAKERHGRVPSASDGQLAADALPMQRGGTTESDHHEEAPSK